MLNVQSSFADKIKKVTAVYFSPTGGTKRAVEMLADSFSAALIDNTLPEQRQRQLHFAADELVLMASPVYAGQLPRLQKQDLWRNLHGSGTPCIIVACYGNRHYDDTMAQMQRIAIEQGFDVIGAAAVVIPHIFAPSLGAGRPNDADAAVLAQFANDVKVKIAGGAAGSVPLVLPGNPNPAPKAAIPVPKSFDEERCIMCGACAALCPVGAIDGETMAIDESLCLSCMRCVKYCRTGARSFDGAAINARLTANFSEPQPVEIFV